MIRVEDRGGVRRITLARAEKRNALTPGMLHDLVIAVAGADEGGARAVLLDGEGPAFCAGFDLSRCREDEAEMAALLTGLSRAIRALRRAPVPVVVCAHGAAIAGGCALLGGADVVITNDAAKLGYPVVRLGVSPAVTSPMLVLAVGAGRTRHRLLDPTLFSGAEAARIGLAAVSCTDAEGARARAERDAALLAGKPPHAVRVTKRWLNEIEGSLEDGLLDAALEASLTLAGGEEERGRLGALWARDGARGASGDRGHDDEYTYRAGGA